MKTLSRLVIVLGLWSPFAARADHLWDLMMFMTTDATVHTASPKTSSTIWATSYAFSVTKGKRFFVGWNVLGVSTSQDSGSGTPITYASTDMGPRLVVLSKSGTWMGALSYNLRNTTSYDPGTGTAENLKGTSLFVELGYLPELNDTWRLGVKLNYYAPSFNESVVNDTTYSQVSYSKTTLFPSISAMATW